jgi:hypothetical protein
MALMRDATPLSERFSVEAMIGGLADDLAALRGGQISVEDARVRAELAKQFLNGVRLVVNAQKFLAANAKEIQAKDQSET